MLLSTHNLALSSVANVRSGITDERNSDTGEYVYQLIQPTSLSTSGDLGGTITVRRKRELPSDDLVRAGSFLIGMYLFIQHLGLVINRYTTTGELSYGSLLVVILSILILLGQSGLLRIYRWVKYLGLRKQSVDHH